MTKRIRLSLGSKPLSTVVSNVFIDKYMAEANGSYVKVYIYLLRCLSDPSADVSVSGFSEKLDETEKDIIRALKYWEKKKLLSISWDADGQISNMMIAQLDGMPDQEIVPEDTLVSEEPEDHRSSVPVEDLKAPTYTPSQIASLKEYHNFEDLIDYVENKLGTLNQTKLNSLAFVYEILDMNSDLIKYLYDYCISKKKTGSRYIESVAISWQSKEIDTVEKALQETFSRSKECAAVKSSFGLQRSLGGVELEYINRWSNEYGMSPDLIREACDRTLIQTSKTDFKYADRILKEWNAKGVSCPEDIARLDEAHHIKTVQAKRSVPSKAASPAPVNKFTQFSQRSYSVDDYEALERKKIGRQ